MNRKGLSCLLLLALFSGMNVFAHGAKDTEEKNAENLSSWQETFDINDHKKGKYNIMITAEDLGGNQTIEGPLNIFIDPNSDMPICGITNPQQDMRVVGNLNIVGTCVDDDSVDHVDLILDGNEENPIRAKGKEFWSYYLDTRELDEGLHSIKVIGYDINGLASEPCSMTWNLDRRQPVTAIDENYSMGSLVSGTVKFSGVVTDGNGIKKLEYSTDGGKFFNELKLTEKKDGSHFTVVVDTKKVEDGPSVIWFKAQDKSGSTGIYSFLYFVDNTKPEVNIVYPLDFKEPQYGKFVVAGYARDKVGITNIDWEFGIDKGSFEVTPGNPYWGIVLDSTKIKESSRKFTVTVKDVAGNVRSVSETIKINQELDKPVVTITEPNAETLIDENDEVYVRGYVTDDDGVAGIRYQLDGGEFVELETKGAFYVKLLEGKDLGNGKHKITVIGKDRNGTEGYPVSVEFTAQGPAPKFSEIKAGSAVLVDGLTVHPEAGTSITGSVSSGTGLSAFHYDLRWGRNGVIANDVELKNAPSNAFSIPLPADGPRGVVKLTATATDVLGRTTDFKSIFYITNTTDVKGTEPKVVFEDSTVSAEGIIVNDTEFPATGYFIGGTAKSVEIVPRTDFAKAVLRGNSIVLEPGAGVGQSDPVIVRVTTDQGKVYESKQLIFRNDTAIPKVSIKGGSGVTIDLNEIMAKKIEEAKAKAEADGTEYEEPALEPVKIVGSARCSTGLGSLRYKIYELRQDLDPKTGVFKTVKNPEKKIDAELPLGSNFEINFDPKEFGKGIFVVEVTAESKAGNKVAEAVMIRNIEEYKGSKALKAPDVKWFTGEDVYSVVVYQGKLEEVPLFKVYKMDSLLEGGNSLSVDFTGPDGKPVSSKYTANKPVNLKAAFAKAGSENYRSGVAVQVPFGKVDNPPVMIAYIDTGAQVSAANFELSGENVPGGQAKITGQAKLSKAEGSNRWTCEIPLANLPVRMTQVKLSIKAGNMSKDLIGNIKVIRPEADATKIDDKRQIYIMEGSGGSYDTETRNYNLREGGCVNFFANVPGPLQSGELTVARNGLKVEVNGNNVAVIVEKDGSYTDVTVRVRDANGVAYTSSPINILADTGAPEVNLSAPVMNQWVRRTLRITGTASDPSGIKSAEYSVDNGVTWQPLSMSYASGRNSPGATFNGTADIAKLEDGLVRVDVRVSDMSGHVRYARTAVFKDTTVPSAEVIVPQEEDVVNGDTLMIFKVTDNGSFEKMNFVAPAAGKEEPKKIEVEASKYVLTYVGTSEKPIGKSMAFEFFDGASNKNSLASWKFNIDTESDLPVAEVHLPTYEEVVTRDFTISGVVYDDDGGCKIFYKIDKGDFIEYEQVGTSFAIDVPFSTMTDNEHTISVYAVDPNGVKGNVTERKFRVSTEEPKGFVDSPTIDTSVKGVVTLKGVASDKNGIEKVMVSIDNGSSYNTATGTNSWSYTFDTRAIPNGTQVVFLKVIDKYGIEGLYSSLINIDNESPEMELELPLDYASTAGPVFFSGHVFDNVEVTDLYVSVRNFEGKTVNSKMAKIDFNKDNIITQVIDLSSLENGVYNLELTALDKAGNATHASRNIQLNKNKPLATVNMLYPLNGEHKNGNFNIYGDITSDKPVETITLYIDGKSVSETTLASTGYFKFPVNSEMMEPGVHKYRVDVKVEGGSVIRSREQTIEYNSIGPWVTIENFDYGNFAMNRPWIKGHAGYSLSEEDAALLKNKKTPKEEKAVIEKKEIEKVELSFNNGKTFQKVSNKGKWQYRVENEDLSEGFHFMLVKATMKNGETAIERIIIQIDNTSPTVKLISPSENGRYNQELEFSGLSSDEVGLKNVKLTLRKGDKSSYEVPAFIQGLYLDLNVWGATLFDIGAGLTFFDNNVKLQFQWGQFTQAQRELFSKTDMRYGGDSVMGIKILANIVKIPFSYFFGRDWSNVSSTIAVGANFSYFNETNSGKGQILSALIAQLELPKFSFPKNKMFSEFAFYTEFSLWFIPTDVSSSGGTDIKNLVPQVSEGFRLNIF